MVGCAEARGPLQPLGVTQAVSGRDGHAGEEQVYVGRTVGQPKLDRLGMDARLGERLRAVRVGVGDHAGQHVTTPGEGHSNQSGAVGLSPADALWRLVAVGEAQVGRRHGVADCSEGLGCRQVTGDQTVFRCR